jgi:hypothetical protein
MPGRSLMSRKSLSSNRPGVRAADRDPRRDQREDPEEHAEHVAGMTDGLTPELVMIAEAASPFGPGEALKQLLEPGLVLLELLQSCKRLAVDLVVVFCFIAVPGRLPVLAHHDDRTRIRGLEREQ